MGALIVVMIGGFYYVAARGMGDIKEVSNRSMELIESLQGDFEELEKKNEALTKELDECKIMNTETSDGKVLTP